MDVRQRGNATQLLEKYKALARDATQGGDRVQAEYFMQYADHYYRVLNEFRARDPQPAPRGYDDDEAEANYNAQGQNYGAPQNYAPPQADGRYADEIDEDEGEEEAPRRQAAPVQNGNDRPGERQNDRQGDRMRAGADQQRSQRSPSYARDDQRDNRPRENAPRENGPRENGQRDNGQRENAPRDYPRGDNGQPRDSQSREAQSRDVQSRETPPREVQPRYAERPAREDRNGEARANGEPRADRPVAPRREPRRDEAPVEPLIMTIPGLPGPATVAPPVEAAAPAAAAPQLFATPEADVPDAGEVPAPRRRGRPRKVVATVDESAGNA